MRGSHMAAARIGSDRRSIDDDDDNPSPLNAQREQHDPVDVGCNARFSWKTSAKTPPAMSWSAPSYRRRPVCLEEALAPLLGLLQDALFVLVGRHLCPRQDCPGPWNREDRGHDQEEEVERVASGLVQVLKDVCVYEGQGVPVERIHQGEADQQTHTIQVDFHDVLREVPRFLG
mmetsp:Transcript_67811/g.187870  ORF Transcript_67811/g.187870 Transcript_67811/m.187870 type:complete len:174 (+) Transcript_67811:75-596(+)